MNDMNRYKGSCRIVKKDGDIYFQFVLFYYPQKEAAIGIFLNRIYRGPEHSLPLRSVKENDVRHCLFV